MNHELYETYAALYVSGQLAPNEQEDFEKHAAACRSCREMANDFASISSVMFAAEGRRYANSRNVRLEAFLMNAAREGVFINNRAAGRRRFLHAVPTCMLLLLLTFTYIHTHHAVPDADRSLMSAQRNDTGSRPIASSVSGVRAIPFPVRAASRRHKAPKPAQNLPSLTEAALPQSYEALPQNFARIQPVFLPLTESDRRPLIDPASSSFAFQHISISDHFLDPPYKTVGAAALKYPENLRFMQPNDFATGMRQLHFHLPLVQ